ncbi:MAG TPA: hypothetical protein VFK06_25265 [Candidatus Angelobacter sp.]|nr:hypothetical protein [Candidatus Angelobacter sp.]
MDLLQQREALLSEYENFLDSGSFNAHKSSEYQARIARLDLKISEQRSSQVVGDRSYRAAPLVASAPVIQGEQRGIDSDTAEKQLRAYDLFLRVRERAVALAPAW